MQMISTKGITPRSGMLSAALSICTLLMYVSASSTRYALAEGMPTLTASEDALSHVQKQIVLRTEQGDPVPGISVQLALAEPTLGGPPAGPQTKTVTTDLQGRALFTSLGQQIWMVSFTGIFRGKTLQSTAEQGRAPYGHTRGGGGFPVMVQRQEEDTAATPLVVQGTPQPEVQPSLFVLMPVQDRWTPALDLALPEEHPISISGYASMQPSATPVVNIAAAASAGGHAPVAGPVTTEESGFDSLVRWFYILPVGVALIALYKGWQDRRQSSPQRWSRAEVVDDVDYSEDQL